MSDTGSRRARFARAGAAVAFMAVCASMFWPWTSSGTGSSVPGHRLASLILEGRTDPWVPRWIGAALFLVPLSGPAGLLGLVYGRRLPGALAAAIVTPAAISCVLLAQLHKLSPGGLGLGAGLSLGGSLAAATFVVVERRESV